MMDGARPKNEETLKETVTSCRWVMAYMGCFCLVVMYALKVNLSLAMICMVKQTDTTSLNNSGSVNESLPSLCQTAEQSGTYETALQKKSANVGGDIEWSTEIQGWILSSFFYGYILTNIPGGYLAGRFGGKRVILVAMVINGVMTLCIPVAARFDEENYQVSAVLVIMLEVIRGIATGVVFPALHNILGRWSPKYERSKLTVFSMTGMTVGIIIMLSTGGFMCEWESFDGGWPSVFYIGGIFCMIFCVLWMLVVYDSPEEHPRITEKEKCLIQSDKDRIQGSKNLKVPWRAMMTSHATWAIIVAAICENFGNYTLLTKLPAFMNDVLQFDIKSNGLFSTLPYVATFLMANVVSHVIDWIRKKHVLTTGRTRKFSVILAFFIPAMCLVAIGHITCEQKYIGVVLLVISVGFTAFSQTGCMVNPQDIAAKYAGEVFGIVNTFATIPGMIAPLLVSLLTPNGTAEEWRVVFYIWAAVYVFGAVFYTIFGEGETQEWALDDGDVTISSQTRASHDEESH